MAPVNHQQLSSSTSTDKLLWLLLFSGLLQLARSNRRLRGDSFLQPTLTKKKTTEEIFKDKTVMVMYTSDKRSKTTP
jgi:hypothetical protein